MERQETQQLLEDIHEKIDAVSRGLMDGVGARQLHQMVDDLYKGLTCELEFTKKESGLYINNGGFETNECSKTSNAQA